MLPRSLSQCLIIATRRGRFLPVVCVEADGPLMDVDVDVDVDVGIDD